MGAGSSDGSMECVCTSVTYCLGSVSSQCVGKLYESMELPCDGVGDTTSQWITTGSDGGLTVFHKSHHFHNISILGENL